MERHPVAAWAVESLRQRREIGLGPAKMGKKNKSNYSAELDELINKVKVDRGK